MASAEVPMENAAEPNVNLLQTHLNVVWDRRQHKFCFAFHTKALGFDL